MPHFVIAGAQKSGSTALFSLMLAHPQFSAPRGKVVRGGGRCCCVVGVVGDVVVCGLGSLNFPSLPSVVGHVGTLPCLVRVQELHFFDRLGTGKRAPVPLTAYLQLLPAATEPTKVQVAAVHSTPHAPPLQPSLNTIRQVPTHCFLALWVASCSVHWGCHTVLHSGCN